MAPGRGSLAEVLPESLKALFGRAATAFPQFRSVAWSGTSGRTFEFRLCPAQPDGLPPQLERSASRLPTDPT